VGSRSKQRQCPQEPREPPQQWLRQWCPSHWMRGTKDQQSPPEMQSTMAARQANDEDFSFWTGYPEGRPRVGSRSTRKPATFNGLRGPQSSFFLFFTETGRKSPKSSHFWVLPVPPCYPGIGTRSRSKWDSSRTRWNTRSRYCSSYSEPQNRVFVVSDVTLGLSRNRSVGRIKGNQATFDNSQRNNLRSCAWVRWDLVR